MKGIVMEVDEKDLVVMKKNGEFIKMKKKGQCPRVGQEIGIPGVKYNRKRAVRRLTALAASFLIFIGAGAGGYAYYTPKGYLDLDINPGIELTNNVFNKIIKSEGANEEGESVIEAAGNLKNKDIGIAVKMILEAADEKGFLIEDEENHVNVLVSGKNKIDNLEKVKNAINNHNEETGIRFSYNVAFEPMESYKKYKVEADKLEITPGKFNLMKKTYGEYETYENKTESDIEGEEESYEDFDAFATEYSTRSVKDIMQYSNRNQGNGNEVKKKKEDIKEIESKENIEKVEGSGTFEEDGNTEKSNGNENAGGSGNTEKGNGNENAGKDGNGNGNGNGNSGSGK